VRRARVHWVARSLAARASLPSLAGLPHGDVLPQILADLSRAERSEHADVLREVSEERGVAIEELARRAQLTLACLLLPASGTYYEILAVQPHASTRQIRQHWAAAIRRYHPDRFGGQNPWLETQAQRLIEAYETLRDPERRRRYDAELKRTGCAEAPAGPAWGRWLPAGRRRRWVPVIAGIGLALLGLAAIALLRFGPDPLPPAPLPPAPKLLEKWLAPAPDGSAFDGPAPRLPPRPQTRPQPRQDPSPRAGAPAP
jgi:hypothetical protein